MRVIFMGFLILLLGLFNSPGAVHADDAKPFDLKIPTAHSDEYSADIAQMHDYMKSQQEKEQKIQLLTLDLEQAKIEVELREKKAALGKSIQFNDSLSKKSLKSAGADVTTLKTPTVSDGTIEVKSVFITKSSKEVVLNVDGVEMTASEGEKVGDSVVKEITSNSVTLVNGANELTKIAIK